ncbi:hypothetical protein, partial [Ralstonia pseudosolanacearum]|uniref:hypothetical protein n=1 Tax=Ralstonia pseudosolanacearum TaxID=1310165 RepID=UPI003221B34E
RHGKRNGGERARQRACRETAGHREQGSIRIGENRTRPERCWGMENAPMRSACSASVNWLAAEKPAGSPGRNDGQRSGRIPFAAHQMRMVLIIK